MPGRHGAGRAHDVRPSRGGRASLASGDHRFGPAQGLHGAVEGQVQQGRWLPPNGLDVSCHVLPLSHRGSLTRIAIEQVFPTNRHRHPPLDPHRHLALPITLLHARASHAHEELHFFLTVVRRPVLGALLVLRAHVLRAIGGVGADDRDRQCRAGELEGQDGEVGREVGEGEGEEGWRCCGVSGGGLLVAVEEGGLLVVVEGEEFVSCSHPQLAHLLDVRNLGNERDHAPDIMQQACRLQLVAVNCWRDKTGNTIILGIKTRNI